MAFSAAALSSPGTNRGQAALRLAFVVWAASGAGVQAQSSTAAGPPASASASSAQKTRLHLQLDPALSPRLRARLRAAIAAELDATLLDASAERVPALAISRTPDGQAVLTLQESSGSVTRTLPWNQDERAVARDVALMASNLVHNQTRDLLADAPAAPAQLAAGVRDVATQPSAPTTGDGATVAGKQGDLPATTGIHAALARGKRAPQKTPRPVRAPRAIGGRLEPYPGIVFTQDVGPAAVGGIAGSLLIGPLQVGARVQADFAPFTYSRIGVSGHLGAHTRIAAVLLDAAAIVGGAFVTHSRNPASSSSDPGAQGATPFVGGRAAVAIVIATFPRLGGHLSIGFAATHEDDLNARVVTYTYVEDSWPASNMDLRTRSVRIGGARTTLQLGVRMQLD